MWRTRLDKAMGVFARSSKAQGMLLSASEYEHMRLATTSDSEGDGGDEEAAPSRERQLKKGREGAGSGEELRGEELKSGDFRNRRASMSLASSKDKRCSASSVRNRPLLTAFDGHMDEKMSEKHGRRSGSEPGMSLSSGFKVDVGWVLTRASAWLALIIGAPLFAQAVWILGSRPAQCGYEAECMRRRASLMAQPVALGCAIVFGLLWHVTTAVLYHYDMDSEPLFVSISHWLRSKFDGHREQDRGDGYSCAKVADCFRKWGCLPTGWCLALLLTSGWSVLCWFPIWALGQSMRHHFLQCLPDRDVRDGLGNFTVCQAQSIGLSDPRAVAWSVQQDVLMTPDVNWFEATVMTVSSLLQTSIVEMSGSLLGCSLFMLSTLVSLEARRSAMIWRQKVAIAKKHRSNVLRRILRNGAPGPFADVARPFLCGSDEVLEAKYLRSATCEQKEQVQHDYYCVDLTCASGPSHLIVWRLTRNLIQFEIQEDTTMAEAFVLIGALGLLSCFVLSVTVWFRGSFLSHTSQFVLILDSVVFGAPVIQAFSTCTAISRHFTKDLVLLLRLKEELLYPAGAWSSTKEDDCSKAMDAEEKDTSDMARTTSLGSAGTWVDRWASNSMAARASCKVDAAILEAQTAAGFCESEEHKGQASVKTVQALHLLRHAACLEAMIKSLRKETPSEQLLGIKLNNATVQKFYVMIAGSVLSSAGQIMKKILVKGH